MSVWQQIVDYWTAENTPVGSAMQMVSYLLMAALGTMLGVVGYKAWLKRKDRHR